MVSNWLGLPFTYLVNLVCYAGSFFLLMNLIIALSLLRVCTGCQYANKFSTGNASRTRPYWVLLAHNDLQTACWSTAVSMFCSEGDSVNQARCPTLRTLCNFRIPVTSGPPPRWSRFIGSQRGPMHFEIWVVPDMYIRG